MSGYVLGGYAVTFVALGAYALRTIVRSRSLSRYLEGDK
jgi:CcmD family protein